MYITYHQRLEHIIEDMVVQTLFVVYKPLYRNTSNLKSLCVPSRCVNEVRRQCKWCGELMDGQTRPLQLESDAG